MRIVNLIENTEGQPGCRYEHGLSFYIETERHRVIMDTGASDGFFANAALRVLELPQCVFLDGECRIDEELFLFSGIEGRRLWPEGNRELKRKEGQV